MDNWLQVTFDCLLGPLKKKVGVDDLLDKVGNEELKKLLEEMSKYGEGKIKDALKRASVTGGTYTCNYKCDSKTSAMFWLTSSMNVRIDGKVVTIPFDAKDESDAFSCEGSVSSRSVRDAIDCLCGKFEEKK